MPLGRFSEQIDYDIRLANTAPLIEEQRVVDIDHLIPLYVYNILLVRHGKTVFGIRQRAILTISQILKVSEKESDRPNI